MSKTEITNVNETALEPVQEATLSPLVQMAMDKDFDVEKIKQMLEVQKEFEAFEAKKAYYRAMNAFKSNPPELFKDKKVSFDTSKGTTEYSHESLGSIGQAITDAMAPHGLSYTWDINQSDAQIKVTCKISHSMGHSEGVSMKTGADQSGGKNNIQAWGSSVKYLQRYTLLAATGLASKYELDDDGHGAEPIPPISQDQLTEITDLIKDIQDRGIPFDEAGFLKRCKAESLETIPNINYTGATNLLYEKMKQGLANDNS